MTSQPDETDPDCVETATLVAPLATWFQDACASLENKIARRRDPDWDDALAIARQKVDRRLRASEAQDQFDGPGDVQAYLDRAVFNEYRRLKKPSKTKRMSGGRLSDEIEDHRDRRTETEIEEDEQANAADNEKQRRAVENCLQALSDKQRQVYQAKLQERPHAEVCDVLGISDDDRRQALSRARKRLRKCLQEHGLYWYGFRTPDA